MWKAELIKLNRIQQRKAEAGASKLSDLTNEEYRIASRGLFWNRRVLTVPVDDFLLVRVYAVGFKPAKYRMVGLFRDSELILLPSELSADLKEVGQLMGVDRSNLFWLYALIIWDYGFVHKGEYPRHLKSKAEAEEVGVVEEFEEAGRLLPDREIWWQKYGGLLYSFNANGERVAFYELGSLSGNFERKL